MQAVTAPASAQAAKVTGAAEIKARALGVMATHLGPLSIGKTLLEAGDAICVANALVDLEATFGVQVDDILCSVTADALAEEVARRHLEPLALTAVHELTTTAPVDLAAQRARRARQPLFPGPNARQMRTARRRAEWRATVATFLQIAALAFFAGCIAGGLGYLLGL